MTNGELIAAADELDRLLIEDEKEHGRQHAVVRGIANALRKGYLDAARCEWHADGDKVSRLFDKPLYEALVRILGCRLHGNHDCGKWICVKIRENRL